MRRRGLGIAALVAATGLLLGGCAPVADDSESARQAEAFPGAYAQTLDWGACGEEFGLGAEFSEHLAEAGADVAAYECAMVEAPLDWNDPGNHATIELAAVHIPSTGAEPIGTLLSNPGGPGESGLNLAFGLPTMPSFDAVLERYDLLGFDPRGIGRSTPVDCAEVSDLMEINLANCAEEHPIARSMGTSQVARDMELLRTLMGDDALHYLGYSYGTMLGASYASIFPERVGRLLLDSASAADWASPIGSFEQSAAIAHELDAMLAECATSYAAEHCPLDGEAALAAEIARLAEEPLRASDGTEVDGSTVSGYLTTALYQSPAGRGMVLDVVGGALMGEQDRIDLIAEEMQGGGAAVTLDGTVVRCHSFPDDPDLVALVEHVEETGMPELLGGPEISDETLQPFVDLSCEGMPGSGDDITDAFSGSEDAPILVVGITGDHATPYAGAEELVRELGNARLLTLEGSGHGASFTGRSSCIDAYSIDYLLSGELPPNGTVCTDD
ncbi:alpha/beta hydrolase [Leucobacter allii]|uniref:alpha/beta hydrolase n=1 Tax=Leucobacter allii TaxID=2932247 RepID=UPI001FCFEF35|nr:alpha/beta hydrolase [Leucobacter allii]UOR01690.1 alpha/beta hydrolase [Leucobacter allii]